MVALATSFLLPKGILRFVIQFKSICLFLASICCTLGELATDQIAPIYFRTVLDHYYVGEEKKDSAFPHISLNPRKSSFVLTQVSLLIGEAAFVGFNRVASLIFLHELFVCTCRHQKRAFNWIGCLGRIVGVSTVSLVVVVTTPRSGNFPCFRTVRGVLPAKNNGNFADPPFKAPLSGYMVTLPSTFPTLPSS